MKLEKELEEEIREEDDEILRVESSRDSYKKLEYDKLTFDNYFYEVLRVI